MLHLADEQLLLQLLKQDMLIPVLAITLGCTIAIIAILVGAVKAMVIGTAREATKREIAAYVAEGTMDPQNAVALIEAGKKPPQGCC